MSLLERFQSILADIETEKNQWAAAHAHALAGGLVVWPGQTVEMTFNAETGAGRITRRKPTNLNIRLLLAGGSIKNKRSLGAFRGQP